MKIISIFHATGLDVCKQKWDTKSYKIVYFLNEKIILKFFQR